MKDRLFVTDSNTPVGLRIDLDNYLLPKMGEKEGAYKSRLEKVMAELLKFMSATHAGRWLLRPNPLLKKRDGKLVSPIDLVASEYGTDKLLNEIVLLSKNGDSI